MMGCHMVGPIVLCAGIGCRDDDNKNWAWYIALYALYIQYMYVYGVCIYIYTNI